MKTRRIVLIFSLILCLGMLVACNADVAEQNAGDKLAYATFKNDAKEFSVSYDGYQSFDDLFWYYKADKLDDYGQTGDTGTLYAKVPGNDQGKGLDGKTEALSEGKWQFTLMAFESALSETETGSKRYDADASSASAIYSGSTPGASEEGIIVIRRNQTNYIPVTVTPVAANGHIKFANAYYVWETGGSASNPDVKITITLPVSTTEYVITKELSYSTTAENYPISGYILLNSTTATGTIADEAPSSDYTNDIPAGVYAASIVITPVDDEDNIIFADQNLSLKVFGGLTATISGSLKELLSTENYFAVPEVDVQVFNPTTTSETVITSTYVAKDDKTTEEKTKVTFPADALTSTNQHSLEIEVFSAAVSESKFVATTTDSQAVAGLDLTLTKVTRTSEGDVTEETVTEFANSEYATIVTYINPGLEDVAVKYNGDDGKDQPIATDEEVEDPTKAKELYTDSGLGYNAATGYLSFKTNHFSEYYVQAKVYVQNVTTEKYYHSLRAAIDDAQENQTIKLLQDTVLDATYTHSNPFLINVENMTLDLNDHEITVNENMSFIIQANGAKLINGSIEGTYTSNTKNARYAICVNDCDGAIIENVTVTGGIIIGGDPDDGYTPGAAPATNVIIRNCTVTQSVKADRYAICAQNTSSVLIESGSFTNPNSNGKVIYGTFAAHDGNPGYITITGGSFDGEISPNDAPEHIMIKGGVFTVDPSALVVEGYVAVKTQENPSLWQVQPLVAKIVRGADTVYYGDLNKALSEVDNNETIILLNDVLYEGCSTSPLKFTATNTARKATLDLNGKKVLAKVNNNASIALLEIYGGNASSTAELTVKDSGNNGSLELTPMVASDSWNVTVPVVSLKQFGEFVLDGGTIRNVAGAASTSDACPYGIDILTTSGNAKCTINGGNVISSGDSGMGIRLFCNSTTHTATLIVNGGYIEGDRRGVWMQNPSNNINKKGVIDINGGSIKADRAVDIGDFNIGGATPSEKTLSINLDDCILTSTNTSNTIAYIVNDVAYVYGSNNSAYYRQNFDNYEITVGNNVVVNN